ncbi:MAG TPA: ATP-binding protein [Nodularia sp. (in: cyanobacteria)]|nr:ATP-binding protein [Nodularia sp. (in: cyanobacteria)]
MNSSVYNHEAARIAALYKYKIIDSAPEQVFDDLTFLAAQICDTPIALINLLDANRQWFKAKIGLEIQQLPTNIGFCRRCVQQRETLVIPDTLADEEYATDAVVTSEPCVRFYAGVPLIVPGGEAIGTICIVDRIPRHITPKQVEALQAISRLIVTQLEVRRNSIEDNTAGKRADVQICEPTLEKKFLRAQSVERIGTLASGIAHDLNNVLSPILMSIYLLKRKCSDRQTQHILSIIENNTKHGINLMKQMLSFVQDMQTDIPKQPVAVPHRVIEVKHLILEMQQIVQQTFPKSISLSTEIQPDLWSIWGNSTQLHQILMNLCLNARDAMPNGGNLSISAVNIFIDENAARMSLDADVGDYILITVTDTGLGINQNILDKIFEPFFTTKEIGQGTGLGLSTVIAIIKEYHGFIKVSTSVGKETKFQVYLPAITA